MRADGITLEELQKINEFFDYLTEHGWGYFYTKAAKKIILKGVMPRTNLYDEFLRVDFEKADEETVDEKDQNTPDLILAG